MSVQCHGKQDANGRCVLCRKYIVYKAQGHIKQEIGWRAKKRSTHGRRLVMDYDFTELDVAHDFASSVFEDPEATNEALRDAVVQLFDALNRLYASRKA